MKRISHYGKDNNCDSLFSVLVSHADGRLLFIILLIIKDRSSYILKGAR